MTTLTEIGRLFKLIEAIHPSWTFTNETVHVWQKLLGHHSYGQLENAVRSALVDCPKPPTPKDVKDRVTPDRAPVTRSTVEQDLAYHRAQKRRGFIRCEWYSTSGKKLYEWLPEKYVTRIIGHYSILGEDFDLGEHPSFDKLNHAPEQLPESTTSMQGIIQQTVKRMSGDLEF